MDERARVGTVLLRRDTIAGMVMTALGAAIVAGALTLPIGTPLRMGAGFLPLCLGIAIAVVGATILFGGLVGGEPAPSFARLRPIAALSASFLAFAAAIEPLGLVVAVFAAVVVAGFATPVRRLWQTALYAVALSAFAVVLFVELLGLPMQVWP
jgi:hypothetical protein